MQRIPAVKVFLISTGSNDTITQEANSKMNGLKTAVLMVTLTLMLVAVGAVIGGRSGMTMALIIAFAMNFISYWFSD